MIHYDDPEVINVGTGEEISIAELARLVSQTVGFKGHLRFDRSMPDGTPRKLMNSEKLKRLGFQHSTSLKEGIALAYEDFLNMHYEYRLS